MMELGTGFAGIDYSTKIKINVYCSAQCVIH